jgi:hypothetical protein
LKSAEGADAAAGRSVRATVARENDGAEIGYFTLLLCLPRRWGMDRFGNEGRLPKIQ